MRLRMRLGEAGRTGVGVPGGRDHLQLTCLALCIPHRWLSEGGRLMAAAETLLFRFGPVVGLIGDLLGRAGLVTAGLHRRRRRTLSAGPRPGPRPGRPQRYATRT